MKRLRPLHCWRDDEHGSAIIEFAIVGPTLIAMLMGVLWMGLQMQKYNALRSIAADVNRYTVVEYQKGDKLTADQIETVTAAAAVKSPYDLAGDQLDVNVTEPSSPISGAKNFHVEMTYTPNNYLEFFGIPPVTMSYSQDIYVSA